jgi:hypothetical protein
MMLELLVGSDTREAQVEMYENRRTSNDIYRCI